MATKKSQRKRRFGAKRSAAPRSKKPSPIPAGFRSITPHLLIDGGADAMEFYKRAFGAKELIRQEAPGGKIIHGRLKIGDSIVMLADAFPDATMAAPTQVGKTTVTIHVYARNVDELWNRAVAAGAKVVMPLEKQFWGERYGQLADPFGHHWSVSQRVAMSKSEKAELERRAMEMFSQTRRVEGGKGSAGASDSTAADRST